MSALVRLYLPVTADIKVADNLKIISSDKITPETKTSYLNYIELNNHSTLRIGRAKSNDLIINNPSVSRFHAALSVSESGAIISDFSSLNGTFLNSRKITFPTEVKNNDSIEIGEIKFRFEFVAQTTETLNDDTDSMQNTQAARLSTQIVTVLLADICGYTSMSQVLPPDKTIAMLNYWTSEVTKIVTSHQGEVDKYIGDCVMSLWRSKSRTPKESAMLAIETGKAIVEKTNEIVKQNLWEFQKEYPWRCRIALNSGEAVIGAMGEGQSRNYTVLGDTINVAFRLERVASKTKSNFVLSSDTANLLDNSIALKEIDRIQLDGRNSKTAIFTLI